MNYPTDLSNVIQHNRHIYEVSYQPLPRKNSRWCFSLNQELGSCLRVVTTREDLDTNYTNMIGYQIGSRNENIFVYIPLNKTYGRIVGINPSCVEYLSPGGS